MSNDDVLFIGPDGIFVDALISQAGDAAEGIYVTFGGLPESELTAKGQQFVQDYERQYDDADPALHRLRLRGGQRDARRHREGLQGSRRRWSAARRCSSRSSPPRTTTASSAPGASTRTATRPSRALRSSGSRTASSSSPAYHRRRRDVAVEMAPSSGGTGRDPVPRVGRRTLDDHG